MLHSGCRTLRQPGFCAYKCWLTFGEAAVPFGDPENCFLTLRRVGMRKTARSQDRKVARPQGLAFIVFLWYTVTVQIPPVRRKRRAGE